MLGKKKTDVNNRKKRAYKKIHFKDIIAEQKQSNTIKTILKFFNSFDIEIIVGGIKNAVQNSLIERDL